MAFCKGLLYDLTGILEDTSPNDVTDSPSICFIAECATSKYLVKYSH